MTRKFMRANLYRYLGQFALVWGVEQTRQALQHLETNEAFWSRLQVAADARQFEAAMLEAIGEEEPQCAGTN